MNNLNIIEHQPENTNSQYRQYKRERKHNAQTLPSGLTHEMMKKYVVYYRETFERNGKIHTREYFKVEGHPKLMKVSTKPWISTKSVKISLADKLLDANQVVSDLENNVYPTSHYTSPIINNDMNNNNDNNNDMNDPKSLEQSNHIQQKGNNFDVHRLMKIWESYLPKYVSIRNVREILGSTLGVTLTFDKKDKTNHYRWSMNHRFSLDDNTGCVDNPTFISNQIQVLRNKLSQKYGMDIMSIV